MQSKFFSLCYLWTVPTLILTSSLSKPNTIRAQGRYEFMTCSVVHRSEWNILIPIQLIQLSSINLDPFTPTQEKFVCLSVWHIKGNLTTCPLICKNLIDDGMVHSVDKALTHLSFVHNICTSVHKRTSAPSHCCYNT